MNILPETNLALENGQLEDELSFWDGLFSGAMLVSGVWLVMLDSPLTPKHFHLQGFV